MKLSVSDRKVESICYKVPVSDDAMGLFIQYGNGLYHKLLAAEGVLTVIFHTPVYDPEGCAIKLLVRRDIDTEDFWWEIEQEINTFLELYG